MQKHPIDFEYRVAGALTYLCTQYEFARTVFSKRTYLGNGNTFPDLSELVDYEWHTLTTEKASEVYEAMKTTGCSLREVSAWYIKQYLQENCEQDEFELQLQVSHKYGTDFCSITMNEMIAVLWAEFNHRDIARQICDFLDNQVILVASYEEGKAYNLPGTNLYFFHNQRDFSELEPEKLPVPKGWPGANLEVIERERKDLPVLEIANQCVFTYRFEHNRRCYDFTVNFRTE